MVSPSGNLEKGTQHTPESTEAKHLVTQPEKMKGLEGLLETISLMDKVSETMGEDRSGDMGGGAQGSTKKSDDTVSVRATALANLPDTPEMRKHLSGYIQKEIKTLRTEVRKKTFRASKPGSAYQINELYKKIRRLNSLLAELMETSVDALKRLFVKVFIDKQAL